LHIESQFFRWPLKTQAEIFGVSAGVQKEISARIQVETVLQGVVSKDFRPDVEWRCWWLSDGPELFERVVDDGD
jgi:hypothetical protein